MRARRWIGPLALLIVAGQAQAQRAPSSEETAKSVHLLERATYGPRPQDVAEVLRLGREAWLDRQLHPERINDSALDARLGAIPAARLSVSELYERFPPPGAARRDSAEMMMAQGDSAPPRRPAGQGAMGPQRMLLELATAKLERAAFSERQLEEVMTDFWFNHFNVFAGKRPVNWLVADYERVAIRPFVFGRFEEMLRATASHPAMLLYLDNAQSVAPDTTRVPRAAQLAERWKTLSPREKEAMVARGTVTPAQAERLEAGDVNPPAQRERGLNENYARELLELHTLGVDGGYTQQDVREVARIFTGWTVLRTGGNAGGEMPYVFRPMQHDRGAKSALGLTFAPGGGEQEGMRLLHHLAEHPSTARHLATKLVEYFVSDQPDPALVDRLAKVYLDTHGDLREVTRALFSSDTFYAPENRAAKLKSPFQLVASAIRMTATQVAVAPALMQTLRELAHVPYMEDAPTGYPATSMEWTSSGAMLSRMNFGLSLASGAARAVTIDPALRRTESISDLAARLLPGRDTGDLVATIEADLQAQGADRRARADRALGLLLGSPAFQKH